MTRALDLIERAERAYSTCESYSDTGTTRFRDEPLATFSTSYVRATDTLTFDYRDPDFRVSFVSTDGRLVTSEATSLSFVPEGATLESAIAYLTGITWGAAVDVPRLLQAIPRGLVRRSPGPPAAVGEEVLDGENCVWVELLRSSRHFMAIGETSALVRRVVNLGNGLSSWDLERYASTADTVVTYEPSWGPKA